MNFTCSQIEREREWIAFSILATPVHWSLRGCRARLFFFSSFLSDNDETDRGKPTSLSDGDILTCLPMRIFRLAPLSSLHRRLWWSAQGYSGRPAESQQAQEEEEEERRRCSKNGKEAATWQMTLRGGFSTHKLVHSCMFLYLFGIFSAANGHSWWLARR